MITRFAMLAAVAAGLAAAAPTPASAQIGGLIKQKVKQKVAQTIAGGDTTSAAKQAAGPTFSEVVLEITPALLDRLEKGLAAEETARQENSARIGKVLTPDDYEVCERTVITGPEGQKFSEQTIQMLDSAKTPEESQKILLERAAELKKLLEPKCGLEPSKAELLRAELARRPAAAAQAASGLTGAQLSILKERILPLCTMTQAAPASTDGVRIPTEYKAIFWVYTAGEVQALQPRCGKLVQALGAGS